MIEKSAMFTNTFDQTGTNGNASGYVLESDGRYRIDNYDTVPAFSSFLPGIAGPDGVPLWCMYVNRAQGAVSFGVANKDNAIAEFLPATWAYQLVGIQGFRTFCKIDGEYYEPFQKDVLSASHDYNRKMWISPDRVEYFESNKTVGLDFGVEYFSPVNQPIGSLVRTVKITNTSDAVKTISGLDGMALILPASFGDFIIKSMRRISEAYASVQLAEKNVPFYSTKVMAHDEAEVIKVTQGNFYYSRLYQDRAFTSLGVVVDPETIFSAESDLVTPRKFISRTSLDLNSQVWENRLPCAMAMFDTVIQPGQTVSIISIIGQSPTKELLGSYLKQYDKIESIESASVQSKKLINSITNPAFMLSNVPVLDGYARQNYLDNVLRGGVPRLMPAANGKAPIYLYSRRHGDLERDYNFFELPMHPLSSGVGNYRDICQNARNNVYFYPQILDHEIRMFVNLLQADGYNPLAVHGYRWKLAESEQENLCPVQNEEAAKEFYKIVGGEFHPGQLLGWVDKYNVRMNNRNQWLCSILEKAECGLSANGHEGGYWIDHWTYIVDLLESFASVYPEKVQQMLTEKSDIGWFDEGAFVQAGKDKYVLRQSGPLQLHAVVDGEPAEPMALTTVLGKLCALLAVKTVSLDCQGRGIEMEAGRPGWNDSLNGLPGLFGSSTCETAEAARLAMWLIEHVDGLPATSFPEQVAEFIEQVVEFLAGGSYDWSKACQLRYEFREKLKTNTSNRSSSVSGDKLYHLLDSVAKLMIAGVNESIDEESGLIDTYYMGKPVDWRMQKNEDGSVKNVPGSDSPMLDVSKIDYKSLPLFLEGQVHLLRLTSSVEKARRIYNSTRDSTLFDVELEMYKLNECLEDCPPEIGRARTFSRGWFENESIWMHMSHKYLLELIRCGLVDEFFKDAQTMLVPFMDPVIYGRSVIENSSFISSSACPDPNARGRGFVARLSGTTAEFIHIWLLLTAGEKIFYLNDGQLNFKLSPVLPANWFTTEKQQIQWGGNAVTIEANSFACSLLGNILLVYHNNLRKNTFGNEAVKPFGYSLDGNEVIESDHLGVELASSIRERQVKRIDVYLQ